VKGTDCTDCGGVDAIIDYNKPLSPDSGFETCTNTCMYPRDGVCDDTRGSKYCDLGTSPAAISSVFLLFCAFLRCF
jgi:hypothetical protein